jgi:C1A family cysteine protease
MRQKSSPPLRTAQHFLLLLLLASVIVIGLPDSLANRPLQSSSATKHPLGAILEHLPGIPQPPALSVLSALPSHFDWRGKDGVNWLTPVKDQGRCGACVAFAVVSAAEAQFKIAYNDPSWNLNLSEQKLFSCTPGATCTGGTTVSSAFSLLQSQGTPDAACYPDNLVDGIDHPCSGGCSDWQSRAYKISGWGPVDNNPVMIEGWLYSHGPLVAAFAVYDDFFSFFNSNPTGVYHWNHVSPYDGGHAVVIVGYDQAQQYWIVKNSWGTTWGDNGYFKIGWGEPANRPIESEVAYVNAGGKPTGNTPLQLSTTVWQYGDTVTWSANGLTPGAVISVTVQGSWGTTPLWTTTASPAGNAGYGFTVGKNILGPGQLIIVDTANNKVLQANYQIGSNPLQISRVTINVDSIDLAFLGKDPSQQSDLGASITITFTAGGVVRRITQTTPFGVQADSFSAVSLTVATPPPSYIFAIKWDDYYGASQYSGAVFTYNAGALLSHKTAAFFTRSAGYVTVNVNSVAIGALGLDPTQQPDLHASISVSLTKDRIPSTITLTSPVQLSVDSGSNIAFTVQASPSGYSFTNQWDDYYGASQHKGTPLSYNVGYTNHKTAAFFSPSSGSQVTISVNSVALSYLGSDPTIQSDLHASVTVTYTQGGAQHSSIVTTPGDVIGVDPSTWVTFSVASAPQGYSFANQWDDYYGASQFKGATFTYNVGSSNHKTAAFFTHQQSATSASLQLSSSTWHYGQTVSWSASGLTAGGPVSVTLQGTGWTLPLWDTTADSRGTAGYSFVVGTNIPSSSNVVVIDKTTGLVLTSSYTLT